MVPAYNEGQRLPTLLADIKRYLDSGVAADYGIEVRFSLVDDGSQPDEAARERALLEQYGLSDAMAFVRFERNRGKGAATRAGFEVGLREQFTYVGFMDADSAISTADLHRALVYLAGSAMNPELAGVIGSRIRMLGRSVSRSAVRHYAGRLFATLVSIGFNCSAYDTQCGLKVFRSSIVERYLDLPLDERWLWDTQLLLAMLHAGELIHELPIDWHEPGGSKVSLVRDSWLMVWGLLRFKHHLAVTMPLRKRPNALQHHGSQGS